VAGLRCAHLRVAAAGTDLRLAGARAGLLQLELLGETRARLAQCAWDRLEVTAAATAAFSCDGAA
jgi:hypothetical protein